MLDKQEKNNKIALIIGLAIPIVMIIFVAISIYLPGFFIKPETDFLYATGNNVYCYGRNNRYTIKNGTLTDTFPIKKETATTTTIIKDGIAIEEKLVPAFSSEIYNECANAEVKFYLHNTSKNDNEEILFEEAVKLKLDSGIESPDGFEVVRVGNGGDFPFIFSGGNRNAYYLRGDKSSQKINVKLSSQDYYNFQFIGWIEE